MLIAVRPTAAQPAKPDSSAVKYVLNREHSKIAFSIGHFFVSSTKGQFLAFDGQISFPLQAPEQGSAVVHVSPGSISTGNSARDEHLRTADFFDAARYPIATFESTQLVKTSNTAGQLTGRLSLHGVTRPITLNVALHTADLEAGRLSFSATTTLKRSDYGMNNFAGVIGDDVTLTVEAEFDRSTE